VICKEFDCEPPLFISFVGFVHVSIYNLLEKTLEWYVEVTEWCFFRSFCLIYFICWFCSCVDLLEKTLEWYVEVTGWCLFWVILSRHRGIGGATHCNALQRTATHCNTLQHTATHCNTLQRSWPGIESLQGSLDERKRWDFVSSPLFIFLFVFLLWFQASNYYRSHWVTVTRKFKVWQTKSSRFLTPNPHSTLKAPNWGMRQAHYSLLI